MYVRLAFAVAAHLNPNILLIDEVLAVGDLAFQRTCLEHAKGLRNRGATVILVSHNMFAIKTVCTRALYLSKGQLGFDGCPEDAIHLYEKESRLDTLPWAQSRLGTDAARCPVSITDIDLLDESGASQTVFEHGERMRVRVHFEAHQPIQRPNFVLSFIRSDDVACCNYNMAMDGFNIPTLSGRGVIEVLVPRLKLVSELYAIHLVVWDQAFQRLYGAQMGATFHVRHELLSTHFGVYHEPAEWSLREEPVRAGLSA
jgi:lipopolysaccharide transport system ATP-binding protein